MQLLQLIATLALQFLLKISLHVRKLFSQSCSRKKRRITSMTNSHYYDARIYAFHVLATQHVLVLHRLTRIFHLWIKCWTYEPKFLPFKEDLEIELFFSVFPTKPGDSLWQYVRWTTVVRSNIWQQTAAGEIRVFSLITAVLIGIPGCLPLSQIISFLTRSAVAWSQWVCDKDRSFMLWTKRVRKKNGGLGLNPPAFNNGTAMWILPKWSPQPWPSGGIVHYGKLYNKRWD